MDRKTQCGLISDDQCHDKRMKEGKEVRGMEQSEERSRQTNKISGFWLRKRKRHHKKNKIEER